MAHPLKGYPPDTCLLFSHSLVHCKLFLILKPSLRRLRTCHPQRQAIKHRS